MESSLRFGPMEFIHIGYKGLYLDVYDQYSLMSAFAREMSRYVWHVELPQSLRVLTSLSPFTLALLLTTDPECHPKAVKSAS